MTGVSVVIPVKDDAEELRRCLQALSRQTLQADQVIVVDNNSGDHSAEIATQWGAEVLFCAEPGIPAAASLGYDHSTQELILRLDADCLPAPTWVQAMVTAFRRFPEAGAVTGGAAFYDGPPLLRGPLRILYLGAYTAAGVSALGHRPLFGSNLGMRREVWAQVSKEIQRQDPELHDDFALSYPVGEISQIRRLSGRHMTMSMRPFFDAGQLRKRFRRGMHTVLVHWPQDFPPRRWKKLLMSGDSSLRRHGLLSGHHG